MEQLYLASTVRIRVYSIGGGRRHYIVHVNINCSAGSLVAEGERRERYGVAAAASLCCGRTIRAVRQIDKQPQ